MSEFDDAVGAALQPSPAQSARVGFAAAADTNPDDYAQAQQVARRTGVPVATVLGMPKDMKRQDAVGSIDFDTLAQTAPATARLLSDVEKASVAHDNVDNMSGIERLLRPVARVVRSALAGTTFDLSAGAYGLGELAYKMDSQMSPTSLFPRGSLLGILSAARDNAINRIGGSLENIRKGQQSAGNWVAGDQSDAGFLEQSINSGFRSFGQMAPGLAATVLTGNPEFALGSAALLQGSQSATTALDAGLSPAQAFAYGTEDATAEYATEMIPVGRLLKDLNVGAPFWKVLAHQAVTEVPTEVAATAWQNFNEWANLHPDQPFQSYVDQLPEAEAQTVISTLVTTALTAGLGHGTHAVVNRMGQRQDKAQQAEAGAALIDNLNQLAGADKLLKRDPGTFEQFIADAANDGPVRQVFIDSKSLMQSGLGGELAKVSPSVASQLDTAIATGGQVAIPIEEYAARVAPTDLAPQLLDHLKTDPEGFSRAEAQQYLQSHVDELQADVARTLAEKQGDDTFKQSADVVKTNIKNQLDAAARFTPQVNDAYSSLVGNFYAVQAARLGITPEELYQRYPLKVGAESVAGQQFDQAGRFDFANTIQPVASRKLAGTVRQVLGEGGLSAGLDGQVLGANIFLNPALDDVAKMQALKLTDAQRRNGMKFAGSIEVNPQRVNEWAQRNDIPVDRALREVLAHEIAHAQRVALNRDVEAPAAETSAHRIERFAAAKPEHFPGIQKVFGVAGERVYNQARKGTRDDYTLDLFGVPESPRADPSAEGPAAGRQDGGLSRDDAPGTYAARTELVQENTRQLGTDHVTTASEAAQALAYLGRAAVERFDALVTDKDGKPLAIVGAFKGALTKTSVYPATIAGEAFRIKGAANIWLAHNHPSGTAEFSTADRQLHQALAEVFRGSGIKMHGLFAIAGKEGDGRAWVFEPTGQYGNDERGATAAPTKSSTVPVVERVYSEEGRLGPAVTSPSTAKELVRQLAGDQTGVILLTAQNEPVAFVPVNPSEAGHLRRDGRMDALYRAISVSNAGNAIIVNNGALGDEATKNLAGLFHSMDARVFDVMETSGDSVRSWAEQGKGMGSRQFNQGARGAFNPETLQISLLKNADLSTFLHESGHAFLEMQFDIASRLQQEAGAFGLDALKPGERELLADTDALLKWFGVRDLAEWHNLDFEEKRVYHEQFARGFEAYLFEGQSPSIELHGLFQRFRAWLLNVYKDLKALHVELTDEVRGVMDRMLASTEEIQLAEQARSMMPLFTSPDQAGMTPEEFAAYQALGTDATNEAVQDLQAKGLRDMQWLHNARGRMVKKLQKEAAAKRAEAQMDVRREVMSQPLYRAWDFLTRKIGTEDQLPPKGKADPDILDPTRDSLFAAIAKLGGIQKSKATAEWGIDAKSKPQSGVFGKPVWRLDGGMPLDLMAEALARHGYLEADEHGKLDLQQFYDRFTEELGGNPQYSNAYDYGAEDAPPVANPDALTAGRLDLGALDGMDLPVEVINALKARRMTAKEGLAPDLVAEMFGFTSGDELVRKLAAAETPKAEIDVLTDVRMLEEHGELATPEAIARTADKAIHNDVRARMVATEANALAKATGQRKVLASAAKEFARAMVARLKVRNISPGQYANAEARAAKAAEKASRAGKLAEAASEKRNQIINLYATRAAYDAQDEVAAGLRYLKKFDSATVRKGLDADYTDQIDALLERFDLAKISNKAVDRRAALVEWIQSQRDKGMEPDIPPELVDAAFRKSYKDMTVEEFRGLVDTVKQIEHLGRLKNKLLTAAGQREYEAARDEIVASIEEYAQGRQADTRTPTTNMGRALQGLKRFWASHIKAATWARVMDGGKDGGPMWEYFIRSANERGDMETAMRAEATAKLSAILDPVFKLGRMGGSGQFFASINRSLNREARLAIALNTGNAGNIQRMLGGEGWTLPQILPVLQSLTAQEWHAVQQVWDHFESYRPQIAAKERRIYGKEPEWVAPQPFSVKTADGQTVEMRGGYYPIKYDPAASQRAEEHADAESAKRQLQGAYTTATTRRSFTKARAEEVNGRPLLYTLAGMYSGVNDVIHDLSWHEWLIDANRLLRSHSIDSAIRQHYGPAAKQQFKSWAADIAEGEKGHDAAVDIALSRLRQGVSASGLGFNAMSALMQPLGITQSITRVGAPWIGRGVMKYLAHPVDLTRQVNEMSSFMENRARTRFRELNELRNQVQDQGAAREFIGHYAYFLMMRGQQLVDVPTWWGAYEKAIAEGNEEERAIALADQAVIDSQGGGMTKDLSAIERGGPAQKLFTVFYSFMNTALNIGVDRTMSADTPAKRAKLAVDYAMLYVIPAILGYFLKAALTPGGSGDDDPEQIAKRLLANEIDYLMGLMVVVREFGEAAKTVTGANDLGRDYTGPAGLRLVSDTGRLAQQAHQGEFDDAFRKAAVNVVGDLLGLPSVQVNRTITGVQALAEGKTANPAALVFGFQEQH